MPEKQDTTTPKPKTESSRPTEQKRVDIASKRPHAPYQQEAAEEFYPEEVIEAEPKGEESVGEHHEELAKLAKEHEDSPHQDDKSRQAGWEADQGNAPDVTTEGGESDNRDGRIDPVSSRATREAQKDQEKQG
jgi:hypothetical protein